MECAIEARDLVRRYGDVVAVDCVSFEILRGEVFGFLGPNGAGKTTTVRMLTGVIEPTGGKATVDGYDVVRDAVASRRRLGIVPEQANVYVDLTVWQNVMLMAQLYGVGRKRRRQRGDELLGLFGLADRRGQKGRALSKGLRQRLMLCMALVSDPAILFLDEPTSGLDVASARLIRQLIARENHENSTTVFLTTHNIHEAEELCGRVAIIDKGRIAAVDSPAALRAQVSASRVVEITFAGLGLDAATLGGVEGVERAEPVPNGFRLQTSAPGRVAQEVACLARERGLEIESINTREPSLEEVFVRITEGSGGG
jgi:ABC-2 type transport system ATP-binding protein